MSKSPRIALTMRLELSSRRFYLGRDYCEALESLGAAPVHIGLIPSRDYVAGVLRESDGLLLPGSDTDVDPARYGEEPHARFKRNIPEKDQTDLLALEVARELNLPVFAICYGMQALNVFHGGTLWQDIESQLDGPYRHDQGEPLERLSHSIDIEKSTQLASLARENSWRVNSHHHQSVKDCGEDLVVSAKARDGVVEAIEGEDPGRFVLGVQWHPELTWRTDDLSRNLFKAFVEECRTFSDSRS